MKKSFLLLILFLLSSNFLVAQSKVYYGVKVGGNISHFYYNGADDTFNTRSKMKFSSHFGAFAEIILNDYYAIQPEILYSVKGARFLKTDDDYKSSFVLKYISVPIFVKYYVTKHLDIEFGPQAAYLLNAREVISDDSYQSSGGGQEVASIVLAEKMSPIDVGVVAGLGYVFDTGLYLSARYNMGILNTYKITSDFHDRLKNGTIQFSVGYNLNY